ncbi:hypothetical protein AX17_002532 [Amanita inopinata Kibby_2008]|nr:hypothetical protein AX17_002532 [Amanita inopinata Kibby_2008]
MHSRLQPLRHRLGESKSVSGTGQSAYPTVPTIVYPHVSVYRSLKLKLQVYSPSVKMQQASHANRGRVPLFGDNDTIEGKVVLDPSCHHSGIVSITVEGAFKYHIPQGGGKAGIYASTTMHVQERKHVFLSLSTTTSVSPAQVSGQSRLAFRDTFLRRRRSATSLDVQPSSTERTYLFSFALAQGCKVWDVLPPTLVPCAKTAFSPASDEYEISYKIIATWKPNDLSIDNLSSVEVPFLLLPEGDCKSRDLIISPNDSWLELPLRSDHPVPLRCAVTLPTSVTFARGSSIPYFVVFTTSPRSHTLAREIAADATISISLLRKLTVTEKIPLPPSPPQSPTSPTSTNEESDAGRSNFLKRVRNGQLLLKGSPIAKATRGAHDIHTPKGKPLPPLPTQETITHSKILQNYVYIGFPKRPRYPRDLKKHSTLEDMAALPDGLYRSKLPLSDNLLPCMEVAGLSVKYYLDVSVLFGQDDLRARIPIRIT